MNVQDRRRNEWGEPQDRQASKLGKPRRLAHLPLFPPLQLLQLC